MLKISYAACPCLSLTFCIDFGAICSWNVSCSLKSPKNPQMPLFWCPKSSKITEFDANRKTVYDLLVINSNQGPISHRYWDTATYWLKNSNFSLPPSQLAPLLRRCLSNLWKSFTDPKTRVFQAADSEDLAILACTVLTDPPVWQTDRWTDT